MLGMTLYIAPELRERTANKPRRPTEYSDLYSLGILLHELLLNFHPIAGFDETIDEINSAMVAGWKYDPSVPGSPENPTGYPVTTLSPELTNLFRRSLSPADRKRPTCSEWHQALVSASGSLKICQVCRIPFVGHRDRRECPQGHPVQRHSLLLEGYQEILLTGRVTVLGRRELGGSKKISRRHLIIRKIGSKLYVEPIGMNLTCILNCGAWCPMAQNQLTALKPNDRLLVASTLLLYGP